MPVKLTWYAYSHLAIYAGAAYLVRCQASLCLSHLCLVSSPGALTVTSPPMSAQLTSYAVSHLLSVPSASVPVKLTWYAYSHLATSSTVSVLWLSILILRTRVPHYLGSENVSVLHLCPHIQSVVSSARTSKVVDVTSQTLLCGDASSMQTRLLQHHP